METQRKHLWHRLLPLLCAFGCSMGGPMRVDQNARDYRFQGLPEKSWSEVKLETSTDHVWSQKKSGALVALRSVCGRYGHVSLRSLTQNLVNTVDAPEVVSEEPVQLDGREGLQTAVKGKVDGVPVQAVFVVLRKDGCIFDFTLTTRGDASEGERRDFDAFVASFRYDGGQG